MSDLSDPIELPQAADDRVREALSLLEKGGVEGLADAPSDLKGLPAFEAFLERSWSLRHENPDEMVRLAMYATLIAGKLEPAELLRDMARRGAKFHKG